jgi:hypothetical protein
MPEFENMKRILIALLASVLCSVALAQQPTAGGGGPQQGRTNNAQPCVGCVGEVLSATATAGSVPLTSTTPANVASVALTAGDWDCRGVVSRTLGATTSVTVLEQSISQTSATLSSSVVDGSTTMLATAANVMVGTTTLLVGSFQVNLPVATTVYLVAKDTFSVSTDAVGGTLACRRRS